MEKKELSMIILGIVAVIAVTGLVLLFKTAIAGKMVWAYPQETLVAEYPAMLATMPKSTPKPWEYFSAGDPERIQDMMRACEMQNKLGKIPAEFTFGIKTEPESVGFNPRECFAAPSTISPIKYCCIPPRPA